jgi:integrase
MINLRISNGYHALKGKVGGKQKTVSLGLKEGAPEGEVMRALTRALDKDRSLWDHLHPDVLAKLKNALSQDETLADLANDPVTKMWSDALALYVQKNGKPTSATRMYLDRVDTYLRSLTEKKGALVDMPVAKMDTAFWEGFTRYYFMNPVLDPKGRLQTDRYGRPEYEWKVKGQSVARAMNPIKAALRLAVNKGWCVMPQFIEPDHRKSVRSFANKDHFAAIVKEAEADKAYHFMLPVLYLHYYTGARPVEVVRLVWNREEVERPELGLCFIDRSNPKQWTITLASKQRTNADPEKTMRTLNVHPELRTILERFNHGFTGHVCRNQHGEKFSYGYDLGKQYGGAYSKPYRTLRKRAGLPDGITPYSFRHGFATRLKRMKDVDIFDVKTSMGHASLVTTHRYVHVDHDHVASLTDRL